MKGAFLTGALAAALAAAGLTAAVLWIVSLATSSSDAWSVAPWLIPAAAAVLGAATYLAEAVVHRRSLTRKRETGEPWAYRAP